jgi:hypothetical protein
MVVNFKARGISRGARKLTRTFTLIIIKKTPLKLCILYSLFNIVTTIGFKNIFYLKYIKIIYIFNIFNIYF